ncbi:MAG: hypothetical protein HY538_07445 [Deltaproteobacteria bacterium]|nr:hypothetical protein [Deltaproteobacteria bacterium]
MKRYVLKGKKVKPCQNLSQWLEFLGSERHLQKTKIGNTLISTVFVGISQEETPLLFETTVFDGNLTLQSQKWETWDEAITGHQRAVQEIRMSSLD